MKKRGIQKYTLFLIVFLLLEAFFMPVITGSMNNSQKTDIIEDEKLFNERATDNGFINITVFEAWDLLNSTEDGRQIPIDVRRWSEYSTERIAPPNPEDWPRWFPYELTSDGPGPINNQGLLLKIFMWIYKDKEIIIYCRTARRTGISAQILIDNGFQGTVYNMLGGINEWKAQGFPTNEGLFPLN